MDHRVNHVIALMRADLKRPLTLDNLARAVNLSESRLRCLFKAETHRTPAGYLKGLRMVEAKHLVETTFFTVKEIAHHVGINDQSHFVRDFERLYGLSPSRLRARPEGEAAGSSTRWR
jgi:transcriptional regulator GlxA family with amidase domain